MLSITLLLALAPVLAPTQDTPLPDERPEVKALLDELGAHIKAKGEQDDPAIATIDKLVPEFPNSGPKDRAAIVKVLGGCFDVKRPKEVAEGVLDDKLYIAAATALGTMGPESTKVLIPLIGDKSHRKNMTLQQRLALSLGKTKSPDGLKTLLGLLKHKDAPMQASGAEALANYSDAPEATRKLVFEEVLNVVVDQFTKKETSPTDSEALERWNTISGPMVKTLQALKTGLTEKDPNLLQRWWNDNKKKSWDEKAG